MVKGNRMKGLPLIIAAFALISQVPSHAAIFTVNYSGAPGERSVYDSYGVVVPDGNEVRLGYFTDDAQVPLVADNLLSLNGLWRLFDTTTIGPPAPAGGGFFSDSQDGDFAREFAGKKIYLWIFKTDGGAAVASDYSNVLEYGLYSKSTGWTFPLVEDPNPINNVKSINTLEIDQKFYGGYDDLAPSGHLNLGAPVPEPSQVFAAFGVVCFLAAAYKKSKSH
jgi:hypothetical protein